MKERINHMRKLSNAIDIIIGRIVRFRLDADKKKTILYTIIAFLVLFVAPAIGETYQHQYKQLCTIYEVYDDGIVDLIDPTGEVFCIDTIEYDYPEFHLSMDCFWCTIAEGEPVLKEHEAARWLTKEKLDSVDWLPADVTLVEKIRKKKKKKSLVSFG